MVNRERDDNVYYARLAEQGERYEDMIRYMKEVAAVSTPFQPPAHCPQQPHILTNKQSVCPWALEAASSLAVIESQVLNLPFNHSEKKKDLTVMNLKIFIFLIWNCLKDMRLWLLGLIASCNNKCLITCAWCM